MLNLETLIENSSAGRFEVAEMVEHGLPLGSLAILKDTGLTVAEISEIVIPARTLKHRKARRERLSYEETDRLVRVGRVLALAFQVFGNPLKALQWLRGTDEELGGRPPLSLLRTEAGGRVVEGKLWQIDEGVFA